LKKGKITSTMRTEPILLRLMGPASFFPRWTIGTGV